jgi:putative NADPH-quinone reductase
VSRRIVVIDGHPDPDRARFCHALAAACADAAQQAHHEVRTIIPADLDVSLVRSQAEWSTGTPPPDIPHCHQTIAWADHLVIVYPLWHGTMPALLKAFLEQVFRPGFAISSDWKRLSKKKPASHRVGRAFGYHLSAVARHHASIAKGLPGTGVPTGSTGSGS